MRFSILPTVAVTLFGSSAIAVAGEETSWQPLPDGPVQRIAFGSCAKHWQPQPIWEGIIAKKPDLFVFLGDNIYADTDGRTAWLVSKGQLTGEWNRLADKPEFQEARAAMPFMATWDNHDYGSHAGGAEFPVKQDAKECFLTFFGEPENSPRWKRSGIYDAKILGPKGKRVQVILLDTKFNRSAYKKDPTPKEERLKAGKVGGYLPDEDPAKTHLGAEQWKWLEAELKKPAELRLLCSSTQVIPDQKGMDEWGNFPRERQRLLDLAKAAGNVVILSGNVHFAEISRDKASGVTEFTSSGMTHINEVYGKAANRYRVGKACSDLNAGLVEIEWEAGQVVMSAFGVDGRTAIRETITVLDARIGGKQGDKADTMKEPNNKNTETGKDSDFIGLSQKAAEALAVKRGLAHRVVSVDGQGRPGTADYREDRINFSIEKGAVVKASRG